MDTQSFSLTLTYFPVFKFRRNWKNKKNANRIFKMCPQRHIRSLKLVPHTKPIPADACSRRVVGPSQLQHWSRPELLGTSADPRGQRCPGNICGFIFTETLASS